MAAECRGLAVLVVFCSNYDMLSVRHAACCTRGAGALPGPMDLTSGRPGRGKRCFTHNPFPFKGEDEHKQNRSLSDAV